MRTILDECHSWFLESAVSTENLVIILVEGLVGELEPTVIAGMDIGPSRPLGVGENSRRVKIVFADIVAWQLVDESFTTGDDYEVRDDGGFIQVMAKSKYLDYVNDNHGWYKDVVGPADLYRIWTENDVMDVISYEAPRISEVAT